MRFPIHTLAGVCALLFASTLSATQSTSYTYNDAGQVLTEDGPRTDVADVTTNTYTEDGLLATTTNALGHIITYAAYDASGNPTSIVDANGVITEYSYHDRGWLLGSTIKHPNNPALDAVTTYTYDAVGLLAGMTLPNGVVIEYEYDDARRLTEVKNSLGERIEYVLDAAGNRTQQRIRDSTGILRYSVTTAYDELSRVMRVLGNHGQNDYQQYDVNDNPVALTDGRNNTTQQTYDALNRVKKIIDPAQAETTFTYNSQNQITSVEDARGNITTYQYDGLGNLLSQASPDTGTTTFTYDSAGNRTSSTDARGVVVNYTYDALNRLTSVQYPAAPSEHVTYLYDSTANGNYGIGRLTGIHTNAVHLDVAYNHQGLITTKYTQVANTFSTTGYRYDLAGNLTGITYPSGREVSYLLDSLGRISAIDTRANGSSPWTSVISAVSYLPFGPASTYQYGNALVHNQDYDLDYRLASVEVEGILERSYGYDPVNNIIGIVNGINFGSSQTFGYDALNRLLSATGSYGTLGYSYDAVGNRLTETRNGVTDSYSYSSTSNQLDMISRVSGNRSFTYDAAGNPTTRTADDNSSQSFTFNQANRMDSVSVNGAPAASYTYNPMGQRITKSLANGSREIYHYDEAGQLLAVIDSSGTILREYVYWGNQQVALIKSGQVYYIHSDHLNTPQVVTDESQQVVWMAEYEPFGKLVENQSNSIELFSRFPGQYLDSETGLYYNYFRDYDPSIGRYIESDPIGLRGGINTYAYVEGNPVSKKDPLGLATYICTRPLSPLPWELGPINHTYACVGDPFNPSSMTCNSTTPSNPGVGQNTWPAGPGSPGVPTSPTDDVYKPEQCDKEEDTDKCIESCIKTQWTYPRPWYGVGPNGTDCQEYTWDTVEKCTRLCQR